LESAEPIAADFRQGKDGRENGSLKLIAGLLNVGLDELVQREKQAERRRRRRANMIAAAMSVLALIAVSGSFAVARLMSGLGARQSITLAELAQDASDAGHFDRAARYARIGLAGADVPIFGFDSSAAELELRRAVAASQAFARLEGHDDAISRAVFSSDGSRILSTSPADGTARLWDVATARTLSRFGSDVVHADLSADGARVVTLSTDRIVRIWNASRANELHRIESADDPIVDAFWDTGCRTIVTTTRAGVITVWDGESARTLRVLNHGSRVSRGAVSPDGARVAIADQFRVVTVWDIATGRSLATSSGHSSEIYTIAFSRDGSRVVTASEDGSARVLDVDGGRDIATLRGHTAPVIAASFDPNGSRVVTVSSDRSVRLWDLDSAQAIPVQAEDDYLPAPVFSPDGATIATTSASGTVKLWDASTGRELLTLRGHEAASANPLFSPDGAYLLTVSQDRAVRVWSVRRPAPRSVSVDDEIFDSVAFDPSGRRVLTGSDEGRARVWDASTGAILFEVGDEDDGDTTAAFSPDGLRFVKISVAGGVSGPVSIWDASNGQQVSRMDGHEDEVYSAAFSADGARLVTASADGNARVWDVATGAETLRLPHDEEVESAAFNSDASQILTVAADGRARLWTTNGGRVLREFGADIRFAVFNRDASLIATTTGDGTTTIWDANARRLVTLHGHFDAAVATLAFSPDGRRLMTASYDGATRVSDTSTGQEVFILQERPRAVTTAVFSGDGSHILTSSDDGAVNVWDAGTGRRLTVLRGHMRPVRSVAFSPDGRSVITASSDGTAQIWRLSPALFESRSALMAQACAQTLRSGLAAFSPRDFQGAPILDPARDVNACGRDNFLGRLLSGLGLQ
jgi:WD40 repeat protein